MRSVPFALLVVLAGSLAGCVGGDGESTDAPAEAADPADLIDPATGAPLTFGVGRFVDDDLPVETHWFNGSFTIQEHGRPQGTFTHLVGHDQGNLHATDIGPLVPAGLPVLLTAQVDAELGEGDLDLWFESAPGEVWATSIHAPYGGHTVIAYTVLHGQGTPLWLVVQYDEIDDSAEFTYTLQLSVGPYTALLPGGVPVAIDLPAGATLEVSLAAGAEGGRLLLWDPDDLLVTEAMLGDTPLREVMGPNRTAGEHVLLLAEGVGPAHVRVAGAGEAPSLRALTQEMMATEVVTVQPGEEATWSFTTDRPPLQVGLSWWGGTINKGTSASLAGPAGEVIGIAFEDDPWIGGGFGIFTDVGTDELPPGTYEARAWLDGVGTDPMHAQAYHVYYARS